MAAVVNCQRSKNSPVIHPKQLHPYFAADNSTKITAESVERLVAMFVSPEKKRKDEAKIEADKKRIAELIERQKRRRAKP